LKRFHIELERGLQRDICGLLLLAMGGVTLLSLLSITHGLLSDLWADLLRHAFGWGGYLVALGLVAMGAVLLFDLGGLRGIQWEKVIGLELLFAGGLALLHIFSLTKDPFALAAAGKGGGYVGWALSHLLLATIGRWGAIFVLSIVLVTSLIVSLDISLSWIQRSLEERTASLHRPPMPVQREKPSPRKAAVKPPPAPRPKPSARKPSRRTRRRARKLPPLTLLEESSPQAVGEAHVRHRIRIIEDTLASFGVPARVVEVNQGPTVTQFGVEPGYIEKRDKDGRVKRRKVKVSAISSLANDLALALAASPIRIQAPVPGRPVVGIEVPNTEVSLVGLRGVMESEEFQAMDSKLKLALGRDVSGRAIVADLAAMPHLLIAGATGSGKSVCIKAIVATLLFNNTPDELRLLMIDPKGVELTSFEGLPHLLGPVVTDVRGVVEALGWVIREMERRYRLFAGAGVRNIDGYNGLGVERLPRIVVVIDELADLMLASPEEVERGICRIAQLARATGIHMVMATQRPSVDVVTGLIKANFPARISFAVTSQVDSRVVLDVGGAEKLLGRGDMLYMASDTSKLVRLQGSFVSDEELERLVRFWRERAPTVREEGQPAPWEEAIQEEVDNLLDEAIELAGKHKSISASFLQRRLRIGRSRAERLMELMEERGIITPAEGVRGSRRVLQPEGRSEERTYGQEEETEES